jgi:hypothetical protein
MWIPLTQQWILATPNPQQKCSNHRRESLLLCRVCFWAPNGQAIMNAFEYTESVLFPLIPVTCQSLDQYTKTGNTFDPDVHIIVGDDFDSQEAARATLERFGKHAMVLHAALGLGVSLQIQFPADLAECPVKFYNDLPDKMPKPRASKVTALPSTVAPGHHDLEGNK